jgi:hypothetical protein
MPDLKLGRLPDRVPVKITFLASPDLNRALQLYADLYREAYGTDEPVSELVPFMLQSFLDADRNFSKATRERQAVEGSPEEAENGTGNRRRSAAASSLAT